MSFAVPLRTDNDIGDDADDDGETQGVLSAPFAWLMCMHALILGDSDSGKTWLVINILLHEYSPYLSYYEKLW